MKTIYLKIGIVFGIFLLQLSCKEVEKPDEKGKLYFKVENTLNSERNDEMIILNRKMLKKYLDSIPLQTVPILKDDQNTIVLTQTDDLDGDGIWDELVILSDFKPKEKKVFSIDWISPEVLPEPKYFTNIRFGVGKDKNSVSEVKEYERSGDPRNNNDLFFQMEGPAWENDLIAFRLYFDPRNGVDIFGKTTSAMVLDSVGLKDDYHKLSDWGMDLLKVGNSLGAGSIAYTFQDSIRRVTGSPKANFSVIKEGPLRSLFKMTYVDSLFDKPVHTNHIIEITKGFPGYKSLVSFSDPNVHLITGLVNLKPNNMQQDSIQNFKYIATYGEQSENKDLLGMAILYPENAKVVQGKFNESSLPISDSYYIKFKEAKDKVYPFYFIAGWEREDSSYKTREGYINRLEAIAVKLSNPIKINFEH